MDEAEALRAELSARGVDRVVLCGMGGSSLAPEVICHRDWAPLTVVDSTHPAEIARALLDLDRTAVVVSSKSGTTVETRSQLTAFEAAFAAAGIDAAERIAVVTDPGSELDSHARERGYRVFLADPQVGGRYSALTEFGLVPSVLAGADVRSLLAEAAAAAAALSADSEENPALRLAAALAAALPRRYLCGVFESQVRGTPLADWIEQLIAESTGKDGAGVLPIALPADAPELRGALPGHELLVELRPDPGPDEGRPDTLTVSGPLGGHFLLWEVATAALCRLIGVNPFDQPDVEAAKAAARALLDAAGTDGSSIGDVEDGVHRPDPEDLVAQLRAALEPDGYLAIQAYLDRRTDAPLAELRGALVKALGVPVALGFGPRYLHSTGQFHKGGPKRGVFLQILDTTPAVIAEAAPLDGASAAAESSGTVLGTDFSALISAQARGDRQVLAALGRPVFSIMENQVEALLATLRR
ncbi:glucose-6-phosphate isomerase [Leucobacter soli]|uniref:glucose-6-phosphate isomerase n=1 Tax=Leucobacter soli TaxID=2812850 RepID=UPI00360D378B